MQQHELHEYESRLQDDLRAALGEQAPEVVNSAYRIELGDGGQWYLNLEAEVKRTDNSTEWVRAAPVPAEEHEAAYEGLLRACLDTEARKN